MPLSFFLFSLEIERIAKCLQRLGRMRIDQLDHCVGAKSVKFGVVGRRMKKKLGSGGLKRCRFPSLRVNG